MGGPHVGVGAVEARGPHGHEVAVNTDRAAEAVADLALQQRLGLGQAGVGGEPGCPHPGGTAALEDESAALHGPARVHPRCPDDGDSAAQIDRRPEPLACPRLRRRQGRGLAPDRAGAGVDVGRPGVRRARQRRADHGRVAVHGERRAEVATHVAREGELLLLRPGRPGPHEGVGGVGGAAGGPDERGGPAHGDGGAERRTGNTVQRLELGHEGPGGAAAGEDVGGPGVGAEGVVLRRADDEQVAVEGDRRAEAGPAAGGPVGREEPRLLGPAGAGPGVDGDDAGADPLEFGPRRHRVAADGRRSAGVLGLGGRRLEERGLAGPGDDAVDGEGVEDEAPQVQVGDAHAVDRQVGRGVGRRHGEGRQPVDHERLDAGEVEGVAPDQDPAGAGGVGAGGVGPGRHAVAGDAQGVAGRAVRAAVEREGRRPVGDAGGEPHERQVVALLAVERGRVAAVVHAGVDVERVRAAAAVDGRVVGVHAAEELDHVVARAERDRLVLDAAAVHVERRRRAAPAQEHPGVGARGGVAAEGPREQLGPAGVGPRRRVGGREDVGELLAHEGEVGVGSGRRVQEVDRVVAALAIDDHWDAPRAVGRRRGEVDQEVGQRVAPGDRRADVDGVVAAPPVDGEGRVLARQRLLALRALEFDGVGPLAGAQDDVLHPAVDDDARPRAAPPHRGRVEAPRRPVVERRQGGVALVAHHERLPVGLALVVEVQFVRRLGALAVDQQRAAHRRQAAQAECPGDGADVDAVLAAAGVQLDRDAGGRGRHEEGVGPGPEPDREVVEAVEHHRAGHVQAGDGVAEVAADVGVVVAAVVEHDRVGAALAVEVQ